MSEEQFGNDNTDPGKLTERERLLRLEMIAERLERSVCKMEKRGGDYVTKEECNGRHPRAPSEPRSVLIQRWITIALLILGALGAYWKLQGLEARLVTIKQPAALTQPAAKAKRAP